MNINLFFLRRLLVRKRVTVFVGRSCLPASLRVGIATRLGAGFCVCKLDGVLRPMSTGTKEDGAARAGAGAGFFLLG